jgi:hypothetical protein
MASTRRRISLIAGVATIAALLALPSLANATVYCVDVSGGDCQSSQPDFQTALDAAKANAGDDTVRLGPMTYTTATPLNGFNYVGGNGAVTIIGSGQGQTTLTVAAQPDVFTINEILVVNHAGSSVSDLTISLPTPTPPNANVPQYRGINATSLTVSDVTINGSSSPTNGFGMIISGSTIRDTTVDLPTGVGFPPMTGIAVSGTTTIEDSSITSDTALRGGPGSLTVRRTALRATDSFGDGLRITSGTASLESSTIDLGSVANSDGIEVGNTNTGFGETIAVSADHLTIANGGSNTNGVRLFANDPSGTDSNTASLTNSVISGPTAPIRRTADNGDTANVTTDYSNYNGAANVSTNGTTGAGAITETNLTNLTPGFVNAASGDFHLLDSSPLIDIGDPAHPAPGELDIDGDARELLGKDGCGPRRDIGADEFVPLSPPTVLPCPPETSILSGPSGPTSDSTPTFTFESSEAASTFKCKIDNGTFDDCTSPFTPVTSLADGPHTFEVKAIDADTNEDPTPASRSFMVDTAPPDTTLSGPSGPTSDSTPTFTFDSTEASSTFKCSVDGAPFANCSSPLTTSTLGDGPHSFAVKAIDSALNEDASPATHSFMVDTAAPDTTITAGPSGPTADSTPTFTFDSSEPSSTFQCSLDGGAFAACGSPFTTTALADGAHTVAVKAIDSALNEDPSPATRTFSVDATAPDTTVSGRSKVKTRKKRARVTWTFGSTEPGTFQCSLDGASFSACTTPYTTKLRRGRHTLSVRSIDALGNVDPAPATFTTKVKRKRVRR